MFLLIVIVILIASASILGNIYMGIFSLQQNYGDINSYYNSYYAAISSIERGLLVTKYKEPSFVGSGGFIGEDNWGEASEMFSGDFGKFTEGENGLVWEIDSYCENITGELNNNNVITISSIVYGINNTGHYEVEESIQTHSFSVSLQLTGSIINKHNNILLSSGNIYRQLDATYYDIDHFLSSTGDTNIDYHDINSTGNITINSGTIDPSNILPTGNTLCTQAGCFNGKTIGELIGSERYLMLYIKDRFITNNGGEIGQLNYNLNFISPSSPEALTDTNCQNYTIIGNGNIGHYKNTLQIKKPAFNYRNPYRQDFIFPYYN